VPGSTPAGIAGAVAEDLVAARLAAQGWTILARNVHVGRAELDIVAIDPGRPASLVVVEVRLRSRRDFGLPEETVDRRKQVRLREAGWRWRSERAGSPDLALRFDLIVVEPGRPPVVRHYRAAF
jgi:putative endonuclease